MVYCLETPAAWTYGATPYAAMGASAAALVAYVQGTASGVPLPPGTYAVGTYPTTPATAVPLTRTGVVVVPRTGAAGAYYYDDSLGGTPTP